MLACINIKLNNYFSQEIGTVKNENEFNYL